MQLIQYDFIYMTDYYLKAICTGNGNGGGEELKNSLLTRGDLKQNQVLGGAANCLDQFGCQEKEKGEKRKI